MKRIDPDAAANHREPGWYEMAITVLNPENEHYLLDLDMPDRPAHLGRLHLPRPDRCGRISAIVRIPAKSRSVRVIAPAGDRIAETSRFEIRKCAPASVLLKMLLSTHRMWQNDRNFRLDKTIRKNTVRLRKKGFSGMLVGAYKDYYRSYLGGSQDTSCRPQSDYERWIQRYDTNDDVKRQRWKSAARRLASGPGISIVMPVHNPDPEHLESAIQSVLGQIYPKWELCIADDASTDSRIHRLLESYASRDRRIRVVRLSNNVGISEATNAALELASHEWITFLDHDDLLREQSLIRVVETLVSQPRIRLLYTDEDKVNERGEREAPHFKPDWNPELLRAVNYICHLAVYDRALLNEIGPLRSECDGAQDYDLVLRATQVLEDENIHHLPEILYHWRMAKGSTAESGQNKDYASQAGLKALADTLRAVTPDARVSKGQFPTTYRVNYPLPETKPLVSIIIPTRNAYGLVKQCIESIREKTDYPGYEIIIVDNGSTDREALDYFETLERSGMARILTLDIPFNYSRLNNFAVAQARGDIIVLMNNDIEVISSNWLSEMVSLASREETGAVGARLLYPDNRIQHAGVILGIGGVAGHSHKYFDRGDPGYFGRLHHRQNLSAVTAACLAVRKSVYTEVGGLDEDNLKVAFNDVDFCLRVRESGYRNVWTPFAELYHHESVSRGPEDTPEKQKRFSNEVAFMQQRWGLKLTLDPAYNPNLTLEHENFDLSFPPRRETFLRDAGETRASDAAACGLQS